VDFAEVSHFLTKKMTRFTGSLRLLQDQRPQTGLDPFEDDSDAKIAAIARKFEEKYCPRKRKLHESDLIDRGKGYDKSDSFVDDTEAVRQSYCNIPNYF